MRGMLSRLNIRNLALVDSLTVSFENGLNVITGETGAGKSLLIGALRLVLGERADKSLIRTGETTCAIEAVFELADPELVNAALESVGLAPCRDTCLGDELVEAHLLFELADRHGLTARLVFTNAGPEP